MLLPKFPQAPGIAALRGIGPETLLLATDTILVRIYFAAGPHPSRWNQFRRAGPSAARWDHHLLRAPDGAEQSRAVLYCARDIDTSAAEAFQSTRRIDRIRSAPGLAVFALREAVTLLDLRGTFAATIGASTAIHSGPRSRARAWARELNEAFPDIQGLYYGSSMNGHAPAIALNERAQRAMPVRPLFHRALNDDMLVDTLQRIAPRLSYGLR
jgi:RES domain